MTEARSATLVYSHGTAEGCQLLGVAGLMEDARYGFAPEPDVVVLNGTHLDRSGLRQMWILPAEAVEHLWQAGAMAWLTVLGHR